MPHSAKSVANKILDIAEGDGVPVTPMQLLKLIYIAHGWHLVTENKPLVSEPILAWKFGPVVRPVYNEFKMFGGDSITSRAMDRDGWPTVVPFRGTDETNRVLNKVWSEYGRYNGPQLMNLTHKPGTPWWTVWHDRGGKDLMNAVIDDDLIRRHFIDKVRQRHAAG